MTVQEIPLTPDPQTFTIELAGTTYRLTLLFRDAAMGGWVLDIADENGVNILCGVPLVTGCDLLAQYEYLNFGGELRVQTGNDPDAVPTFANLGSASHVYFVTP